MMRFLPIIGAIVAAFLLWQFVMMFHDWNRTQTCATAGLRNCGTRSASP